MPRHSSLSRKNKNNGEVSQSQGGTERACE